MTADRLLDDLAKALAERCTRGAADGLLRRMSERLRAQSVAHALDGKFYDAALDAGIADNIDARADAVYQSTVPPTVEPEDGR